MAAKIKMSNLKVDLPKSMIAFIEKQAKELQISFDEYVCNIIRKAQEAKMQKEQ